MNPTLKFAAVTAATGLLLALTSAPTLASQRFQPNAAGDEISDTTTNLIWRRCAEGQSWNGSTCAGTALSLTWAKALTRANNQASNSGLAWRLPNAKELTSLINTGRSLPATNTTAFPGTLPSAFWTATPYAGIVNSPFVVDFAFGYVYPSAAAATQSAAVRFVRVGP